MNVNRRWSGANKFRVRVLGAGLVLVAAGCMVLGWSSRSRQSASNALPAISAPALQLGAATPATVALSQDAKKQALSVFGQLPLIFEPNQGQAGSSVKFLARGRGYDLALVADGAILSLTGHDANSATQTESLTMKLAGAGVNPSARVTGAELLPGTSNYFFGNNPAQWHRSIPQFARVRYEQVYSGINLVFYGNQGHPEFDFKVAPGANPAQAELEFGHAQQVTLDNGTLILQGEVGSVRMAAPLVYQMIDGRQQPVEGRFVMRASNHVGFEIGPYDHSRELVIDPLPEFSSYFGGSGSETSPSIAVDQSGSIYLAGSTTSSSGFPATAISTQVGANAHIFVAKIIPTNPPSVAYEAFLGGTGSDTNVGLAVDGGGNAFFAGNTSSADFPTTATNAYQTGPKPGSTGTQHAFVSALDPTGTTLLYSSYLSGSGTDTASGMAADSQGNVYVTGTTTSTSASLDAGGGLNQFPVTGSPETVPFQVVAPGPLQFFVTKVNTASFGIDSVPYSTYFGGGVPSGAIAQGGGITVDSTGSIYFSGTTNFLYTGTAKTVDFPILNAYQPCLDLSPPTVVSNPQTCTYTTTTPTTTDAFVAKLNPAKSSGAQLIWSTYFGGSQDDTGVAVAVDSAAAGVYLTGSTDSPDITQISSIGAYQHCLDANPPVGTACPTITAPAPTDAYVVRLSNPTTGNMAASYFSYLGGSGNDAGLAIAVDSFGGALVTGFTQSTDFPIFPNSTSNPTCTPSNPCVLQPVLNGPQNAFYARLNTTTITGQNSLGAYATYFGGNGTDRGTGITIDPNLNTYFTGDTTSSNLSGVGLLADALQTTLNGPSDAFAVKFGTAADLAITNATISGSKTTNPPVSTGAQVSAVYTVANNGPDLATNITVELQLPANTTFVSASATSGTCTQTVTTGSNPVCTIASLQSGSTVTVTFVITPNKPGSYQATAQVSALHNQDPNGSNDGQNTPAFFTATSFALSVSPSSVSIPAAGDVATYVAKLSPVDGSFPANIAMTASGMPTGATAGFTQTTVTLNGGPTSSTLNIATTARPVTTASRKTPLGPFYAIGLAVPGMALLGFGVGDRRRRRLLGILALGAVCALLILQPACSGSKTTQTVSGTPAGTYTITITATSGTLTQSTPVTLTVP